MKSRRRCSPIRSSSPLTPARSRALTWRRCAASNCSRTARERTSANLRTPPPRPAAATPRPSRSPPTARAAARWSSAIPSPPRSGKRPTAWCSTPRASRSFRAGRSSITSATRNGRACSFRWFRARPFRLSRTCRNRSIVTAPSSRSPRTSISSRRSMTPKTRPAAARATVRAAVAEWAAASAAAEVRRSR